MTELEEYNALSWQILEHKCRYYIFLTQTITDYEYDQLERKYEALAAKLGLPTSASDMVDFDITRPSCQTVYNKLNPTKRSRRG